MKDYHVNLKELQKAMVDSDLNSIKDLSAASGIDRNTLGKVLAGKIYPSSKVMFAITEALALKGDEAANIFLLSTYLTRKF